jgi:hypothetical protein
MADKLIPGARDKTTTQMEIVKHSYRKSTRNCALEPICRPAYANITSMQPAPVALAVQLQSENGRHCVEHEGRTRNLLSR